MDNNKTGYIQLAATGNIRLMVQTPNTQVWKKKRDSKQYSKTAYT